MSRVEYSRLIKQLSDYQEYEYDWDGDGASPLENDSVKNVKKVLEEADDELLKGWRLSPERNGSVLLSSYKGNSDIQIDKSKVTYFIKHSNGELEGESSVAFSANKIIDVLKKYQFYFHNQVNIAKISL